MNPLQQILQMLAENRSRMESRPVDSRTGTYGFLSPDVTSAIQSGRSHPYSQLLERIMGGQPGNGFLDYLLGSSIDPGFVQSPPPTDIPPAPGFTRPSGGANMDPRFARRLPNINFGPSVRRGGGNINNIR